MSPLRKVKHPISPEGDYSEFVDFKRIPLGVRDRILENQRILTFRSGLKNKIDAFRKAREAIIGNF
jgi:hypothetical protein